MKIKRINILKNSVLINFVISYILVFLLPLGIISVFFYHTSLNIVKNEVHNAKISIVNQFRRSIDNEINSMSATVNYLNNNIELDSLFRLRENEFDAKSRFDLIKISKDLSLYKSTDLFIDEIYIFLNLSNRCITSGNSKYAIESFDDLHKPNKENIDYEKWQNIMHTYYKGDLISISLNKKTELNSNLYFIKTLPILPPNKNYASVVFRFNSELIKEAMGIKVNDDTYHYDNMYIINSKNEVLISNKDNKLENIDYSMFINTNGYINIDKNIIYYSKSNMTSDIYILIIPEESFLRELNNIQKISIIVLLLCILLGAILIYFFTLRNYNPVKNLLNIMKQLTNKQVSDKDEYTQIRLALLDALDEKAKYEIQIKNTNEKQNERKIFKIISKKELKEDDIKELLSKEGIIFNHEYFCSLKIMLSDYGIGFFDDDLETDNIAQILFICKNVYEEIFKASYNLLIFTNEKSLLFLINLDEKSELQLSKIKNIIKDAQKFLRDNYVVDSYAAISNIHKGLESIKITLNEVDESIKYFELIGKGTIVAYNDFSRLSYTERLMKFIIKEEKTLIGNIRAYDFKNARKTLDLIFEKYFFDEVKSPQLIRCRLFSLVNNIIDELSKLDIPDKYSFIENIHPYSRILNCNSAYEFQTQLNLLLDEIGKIFEENNNYDNQLKEQIIKIVEQNYKNPDLNVSYIADKVGKNLDYISRYFKKTAMIGLLDYIHHIRIEKAKELLKSDKYTIEQVSELVGYTSCDSFIRAFKRIEGMTPGKFRSN